MKKMCGVCKVSSGMVLGKDLFNILSAHGEKGLTPTICNSCLFEYFLDSQWDVGWSKRAYTLYNVIAGLTARKTALRKHLISLGTAALSVMCIKCNDNMFFNLDRRSIPSWLLKANEDYLSQYVPKRYHKEYGNLLCEKCASKYEIAFVWSIPKDDLPLHITDEWLFNPSSLLYEKRLKITLT